MTTRVRKTIIAHLPDDTVQLEQGAPGPDTTLGGAISGEVHHIHTVTPPDPVAIPGMAPWLVALLRAIATAVFAGVTVGATTWSQTSDAKLIILAVLATVVPILASRFGAEATVDTSRANLAAAQAVHK